MHHLNSFIWDLNCPRLQKSVNAALTVQTLQYQHFGTSFSKTSYYTTVYNTLWNNLKVTDVFPFFSSTSTMTIGDTPKTQLMQKKNQVKKSQMVTFSDNVP